MSKSFCTLMCVLLAVLAAAPFAYAIPSFRGYTGLLVIPTADALDQGEWDVGLFSEKIDDGLTDIIGTYGFSDGLEVGINSNKPTDSDDRETLIYGKYRFIPETDARPAVAAGIIDLTSQVETTVYVVASKVLTASFGTYEGEIIGPRIHVGIGGGEFSPLFFGLSTYLGNRLQVMGEWDSQFWYGGAKWRITPGLTLQTGFFKIGKGTDWGLGGSYQRTF